MRILTKEEAKKMSIDFVYDKQDMAVAIIRKDFHDRYDILPKKK